mgnify:FL=1
MKEEEERSRLVRRAGVVVISAVSIRVVLPAEDDEEFLFLVLRRGPVDGVAMEEDEGGSGDGVAMADIDGPPAAVVGPELDISFLRRTQQ